jgi:hypothetical protein
MLVHFLAKSALIGRLKSLNNPLETLIGRLESLICLSEALIGRLKSLNNPPEPLIGRLDSDLSVGGSDWSP